VLKAPEAGFGLLDVTVAVFLLSVAAAGIAHLVGLAILDTWEAREQSSATLLAVQKMEQLRAEPRLVAGGSLEGSAAGFEDYLNGDGGPVAELGPTSGIVFVRRWSIAPAGVDGFVSVQVRVSPWRREVRRLGSAGRVAGDAWLVTLRPW
jgi:hypothetical protein